jgi:hypothetical protein
VAPNSTSYTPGAGDVAAERQNSRVPVESAVPRGGEVGAPLENDPVDVDERLDVVDHGRLAEQAGRGRERRLLAGLAAEPLDRVEEGGLLAADVGALAAPELDVEGRARPHHIVTEQTGRPGLVDGMRSRRVATGYSPRT